MVCSRAAAVFKLRLGHEGISLSVYGADGLTAGKMGRLFAARHGLYYDPRVSPGFSLSYVRVLPRQANHMFIASKLIVCSSGMMYVFCLITFVPVMFRFPQVLSCLRIVA